MTSRKLKVGTRGSELALKQVSLVTQALIAKEPNLQIEVIVFTTEGDKFEGPIPERAVGKAWFTAEIESALIDRRIDFAVHSLKDMPIEIVDELVVFTTGVREDPRDALISGGRNLELLAPRSIIGTDSSRRQAQILHKRPDVIVKSIRGNVGTRLRKLREEDYDAIVIAAAGLARLGRIAEVTQFLDPTKFVPAIGQGVLAVEARRNHSDLIELLNKVQDPDTQLTAMAERKFSETIGGGCKLPIGCYAVLSNSTITIHGMIGTSNGKKLVRDTISGPTGSAQELSEQLAHAMLKKCDFSLELDH